MSIPVLDQIVDAIASALGPLSPFTKAVVPAAVAVAYLLIALIVNGSVSSSSLTVAISGLVAAVLVYLLPNKPKPAPVVPPVK